MQDETNKEQKELLTYLHRTLADLHELLNPRSPTPHQNAVAAHAKAWEALKVAAAAGILS